MEKIIRTEEGTIQKIITTEEIINLADLERRRDELQAMVNVDIATSEEINRIRTELDKTDLSEDEKNNIIGHIGFSGTGVTQNAVDAIQAKIDSYTSLPTETKIDIEKIVIK